MARKKKSWEEKLADARVKAAEPNRFFCEESKQWFVVPAFPEVEAAIRGIRKGRILTLKELTDRFRDRYEVDVCCPMTTGIFAWVLSHAMWSAEQGGARRVAPWWRLVKSDRSLNPKGPGGGEVQRRKLEAEGHEIVAKGKRLLVGAG